MTRVRQHTFYENLNFIHIGTTLETRDVNEPVLSGSDGLLKSLKTPRAVSKAHMLIRHSYNIYYPAKALCS